jgi:hypothetical protein
LDSCVPLPIQWRQSRSPVVDGGREGCWNDEGEEGCPATRAGSVCTLVCQTFGRTRVFSFVRFAECGCLVDGRSVDGDAVANPID